MPECSHIPIEEACLQDGCHLVVRKTGRARAFIFSVESEDASFDSLSMSDSDKHRALDAKLADALLKIVKGDLARRLAVMSETLAKRGIVLAWVSWPAAVPTMAPRTSIAVRLSDVTCGPAMIGGPLSVARVGRVGQQSLRMLHGTRDGIGIGHCTPRSALAGKSGVQRHQDVMHVCRSTDELTVVGKPHAEGVRFLPRLGGDVGQSLTHSQRAKTRPACKGPWGSPCSAPRAARWMRPLGNSMSAATLWRQPVQGAMSGRASDMVSSTPCHSKDGKQLTKSAPITAHTPLAGS